MSPERWASFDCYGTLIDWDRGMASAIGHIATDKTAAVLDAFHDFEPLVEQEQPYRRYREVLAETLRRAAFRENLTLAPGQERVLADTLPQWPVFADVAEPLDAVRQAGWKLAILSNVDRDLIEGTLEHLPVRFDRVITAEEVGSYKPALAHWRLLQAEPGVTSQNWVHVARSYYHDILPAHELGIRSIWINRNREPLDAAAATRVLHTLNQLPQALESMAES
jgi:2-haloacid dehalogenase